MQLYDGPPPGYEEAQVQAQIFRWGPGKSGPRLIQDLSGHDLERRPNNVIRFPKSLLEDTNIDEAHSWIIDLAHNEEFNDAKTLRACCEKTRLHLEMNVEYDSDSEEAMASHCQVKGKLHHFQLVEEDTVQQPGKYGGFRWSCSRCPTVLIVRLRAPEIPQDLLSELYKIRPQSSFSSPAGTLDENRPSRFSTFIGLEYLLRNTADFNLAGVPDQQPREVQYVPGSMFERRVGHEKQVIELMKAMMFTFCPADHEVGQYIDEDMALDEMETDGVDWVFRPANPVQLGIRNRYRRLRLEMQIIACKAREDLRDVHRARPWLVKHERAEIHMRRLLDAQMSLYTNVTNSFTVDENTAEEPCFHKLGCTSLFNDKVLVDFYSLQVKYDEPNTSFYLSALEAIAKKRHSVTLLTEFQRQKSMGAYTRQDLREAYMSLLSSANVVIDLDSERPYTNEDDETLINIAASLIMDNDAAKHKIRQALEIIGKERDSKEIRRYLNMPEREFLDVDSALTYLGAQDTTDDDFLIILFDLKQEENLELARSALLTIADERKNTRLKRFLDTGDRSAMPTVSFTLPDQTDTEMLDPDLAYSRLGVDDRNTDDDLLIMLYEIRVADDPQEAGALKKALEVLGNSRGSKTIQNFVGTGTKDIIMYTPPEASSERPVGLENIGNTCYLNSLLQYYFTLKPLRTAILTLDNLIEDDLGESVLKRKKVGGRAVTSEEIERALRFVKELRTLFRSLISAQKASLKPSRAVCFLALVSQRDEKANQDSTRSATLTSAQLEKGSGLNMHASPDNQMVLVGQTYTEPPRNPTSLVEESGRSPKRKASLDNHPLEANHSPMHLDMDAESSVNSVSGQLDLSAELRGTLTADSINIDGYHKKNKTEADGDGDSPLGPEHIEEIVEVKENTSVLIDAPLDSTPKMSPNHRRKSSLLWSETNDWGRQQDVAECIDNVLFQLEAALKPTGFDTSGEQVDLVKDLFYGVTKQTLGVPGGQPKFERFSNTIVTLDSDGQDIYQALDGVFDARQVELGGKQVKLNLTVQQAPPILQIQVQRVGFDLKTMSAIKSNIYLALDQSIYVDRYLETNDASMLERREEYWQWKQDLAALQTRRGEVQNLISDAEIAGPQHNDHLWSATENEVGSDDDTAEEIELARIRRGSVREVPTSATDEEQVPMTVQPSTDELARELRSIEAEERDLSYRLSHAFDTHTAHEYRLHSVFIHRGEASHGHYWVYIYDFVRDKWRKYNDEEVSDVTRGEVFRVRKGDNENPYMLSYVRADQLHLTDALERDMGKTWEEDSLL